MDSAPHPKGKPEEGAVPSDENLEGSVIGEQSGAGARGPLLPIHARRTGILAFCPWHTVDSVTHVLPEALLGRGIEGIILDLDNTLVGWHQEDMTEEVVSWLEALKSAGLKLCILSNSVLSKRSERIAERLGCPNVRMARKPSRAGFHKAMTAMGTQSSNTAIVGDQLFTDILGGNRAGVLTILVRPLAKQEFVYTRLVSRPPERLLLRWFKKRGHLP